MLSEHSVTLTKHSAMQSNLRLDHENSHEQLRRTKAGKKSRLTSSSTKQRDGRDLMHDQGERSPGSSVSGSSVYVVCGSWVQRRRQLGSEKVPTVCIEDRSSCLMIHKSMCSRTISNNFWKNMGKLLEEPMLFTGFIGIRFP
jgi:hypothetical protein